jgi:hypothetical protein
LKIEIFRKYARATLGKMEEEIKEKRHSLQEYSHVAPSQSM